MKINYHDNTTKLLEKVLTITINEIFVRLRMGLADWDLDASLREALEKSSEANKIKDLVKKYDETYDRASRSNIKLNEKYKSLYKLQIK